MKVLQTIQSELKAPKNQYNSFGKYKYRSCEDILLAVKPLLAKYNCTLVLSDQVREVANIPYVEATAIFSDGTNQIEAKAQAGINPNRKGMDIAQSFGSSSSYARKYCLSGMFLLDDTKDADATNDHSSSTAVKPEKEELTPNHEKWNKALMSMQDGSTNIKTIEKYFKLNKKNKALLCG